MDKDLDTARAEFMERAVRQMRGEPREVDNIQLAVLLDHIAARLKAGLEHADKMLPADVERQPVAHYTGEKSWIDVLKPDSWVTRYEGTPVALADLQVLAADLEKQIAALYGKKDGVI